MKPQQEKPLPKTIQLKDINIKKPKPKPVLKEYHMKANITFVREYIDSKQHKSRYNNPEKGLKKGQFYNKDGYLAEPITINDYSKIVFASSPQDADDEMLNLLMNEFNKGGIWYIDTLTTINTYRGRQNVSRPLLIFNKF